MQLDLCCFKVVKRKRDFPKLPFSEFIFRLGNLLGFFGRLKLQWCREQRVGFVFF